MVNLLTYTHISNKPGQLKIRNTGSSTPAVDIKVTIATLVKS